MLLVTQVKAGAEEAEKLREELKMLEKRQLTEAGTPANSEVLQHQLEELQAEKQEFLVRISLVSEQ